jgi:hypothetical protein
MSRETIYGRIRRFRTDAARAQTSIDFVVGMSVFLLTVAFVVSFLPNVFEPFTATGAGDTLAADRTASLLAEQVLAHPAKPGIVAPACAAEFFDGDGADGTGDCQFTTDGADLDAALGLSSTTAVNVTIEEDGVVQSAQGVTLAVGPEPPEDDSVVVSRRIVLLGEEDRSLYVRLW